MELPLAFVFLFSAAASALTVTNSSTPALTPARPTEPLPTLTGRPTDSGIPCCYVNPTNVGLGQWYNRSVTATVATVITQYLEYNNTVVTSISTYTNESATRTDALGLGYLVENGVYENTQVVFGTSTEMSGVPLVSPTPFYIVRQVDVGNGIQSIKTDSTGVNTYCQASTFGPFLQPSFLYFPTSASWYTRRDGILVGQDFISTLIDELAESGTTIPGLESCTIRYGEGAPSIHVPVSALTEHSTTTRKMQGGLPGVFEPSPSKTAEPVKETTEEPKTTATPAPQPSPTAPETTTQAPTTTARPTEDRPNNPSNTEAEPEPSSNNVPPASENPPTPPADTQPAPILAPSLTIGTTVVPVATTGTGNSGGVIIGDVTLLPSSVVTLNDQTLSLGPSGTGLVVVGTAGSSTLELFTPAPQPAQSIVIGTDPIPISRPSKTEEGVILPGGTTLAPGSVVTFQGQTLSLESGGSSIVVAASGTTTAVALFTPAASNPEETGSQETVISIGTAPYTLVYATASGGGVILSDSQTLLPGSTTVVDGTTMSLGPEGTQLMVGTSAVPLQPPGATADVSTTGPGSSVWNGIGGGSPTSTPAAFTGGSGGGSSDGQFRGGFVAAVIVIFHVALQ